MLDVRGAEGSWTWISNESYDEVNDISECNLQFLWNFLVNADSQVMDQSVYAVFGGALSRKVIMGSTKADIQLPGSWIFLFCASQTC